MRLRIVALGLLAGCSSSSNSSRPNDGSCADGTYLGGVGIAVMDSTNSTPQLNGSFIQRSLPADAGGPIMSDGPCQVWETSVGVACTPACADGDVCTIDGTCVHAPPPASVGTVRLTGWGPSPLSFQPVIAGPTIYYASEPTFDDPVGNPLGPAPAPGTALALDAAGGDLAPFSLTAHMVAPVAFGWNAAPTIPRGQPLTLQWNRPDQPGQSYILAVVNFGASLVYATCTLPDTGQGAIPASILTPLAGDPGTTDTWGVSLTRYSATSRQIGPGCVTFSVSSHVEGLFSIQN